MVPNSYFRRDANPESMSGALKMEHDGLYWGQQQQIDPLGQNVYPVQASGSSQGTSIQFSASPSSSTHLQALRDFMSQGNSTGSVPLYSQQLVPLPPPLLVPLGEDSSHFSRSALPDVDMRGQYRGDVFGSEKTPHRTQLQRESHILAERQRREEMNDKFSSLRAMLPKSSKKDKASIVGDTINYVVDLEKTLKRLQACRAKRKGCHIPKEKSLKSSPSSDPKLEASKTDTVQRLPVQVEVQALGEQAVVKLVCGKSPKLVLRILTALEQCKVEVLQSNVTTLGDIAVHFFTIELTPGVSATTEELIAALEAAAAAMNSSTS
ncbi:hypothetical protein SELMODRAFT_422169 [Selaginella moellendorffii]|uniref:BHLH domain-containing protein n=1 Tax=Selaginella moellendorffii TaxID=88036 RepID=D8SHK0_SELML|nr:transcription factor bHLH94 isoform X1 [Selaginella moellendorffii]EFJ16018.1 hypothetical protein SELMODRAFT_422169 [Selaginella moellendorffii]|eukprot:XP_002982773.1 transcription factor bHLH94 isoform X1 [Selaginella moellendorffii]